jgi:cytochrome c-type biogenesis protein CcmF
LDIAEILLAASFLLIIIDILSLIMPKFVPWKRKPALGVLGGALIVVSYIILVYHFVSNHFNYEEVFYYSSTSLSVIERVYATWASSKGSWLLFTSFIAVGYIVLRHRLDVREHKRSFIYLGLVLLAFIVILLAESPFATLATGHIAILDGQGLNPLLLSPWMIIHPLVVFAGYAMIVFAFATTLDGLGEGSTSVLPRVLAQWAWLFMTLGITLGGIWAYVVLGWGGYWGWDPVETGSLLSWLALTAYFHMTRDNFKGASARETLLMVACGMVFFAGAITRGGFVSSVHAFGFSDAGLVLVLILVAQTAYFLNSAGRKHEPLMGLEVNTSSVYSLSLALSFVSIAAIMVVSTWGLLLPILQFAFTGFQTTVGPEFFTKWVYPPTLLFVLSLIGCQTKFRLSIRQFLTVTGGALALGAVFAYVGYPSANLFANFGIPSILAALASVVIGLLPFRGGAGITAPRGFIHLGVVLILIGVFVSSSMKVDTGMHLVSPGTKITSGDVNVTFGNFTVVKPYGRVLYQYSFYPQAAGIEVPVTVASNQGTSSGSMKILYYTLNGVVSEPYVSSGLSDVYITVYISDQTNAYLSRILNGTDTLPPSITVDIVINPLVNVVWLGCAVMSLGILAQMALHPVKQPKINVKPIVARKT